MKTISIKYGKAILPALAFLAIVGLIIAGCSKQLQQSNPNQQTAATFWKTSTDAYNAGNSIYGSLILDGSYMRFAHVILNTRGDDATSNSPWNEIYNCGKFDLDVNGFCTTVTFQAFYQGVLRANEVLENVPGINMDQALKDRVLGQAYFLRALYFFHLSSIYNNIPMPLTVAQSSAGYYVKQSLRDTVYLQCIADFQKASTLLPQSYAGVTGPDKGQVGRATKGAALAYLGKVYLFLKNYTAADQAFQTVMTLGYSLMPNYHDNFTDQVENNAESIFEVQFSRNVGGTQNGWGPGDPDGTWGKYEGRAVTFGPRNFAFGDVQPSKALYYEFLQEKTTTSQVDPRLYATMFYNTPTMTVYGKSFQGVYGVADSEVFCRKYENDGFYPDEFTPAAFNSGINSRLMRYADVLLMDAECQNEMNQTAQAYPLIQQVRTRAGLPDLATAKPNMTQQQMRDQIAHERFLEFGLEGHRFDDIVRWGWLQDPTKLAYLKSRDPEFNTYFPGREYMPIPLAEIQANPGIKQNPGW